MVRSCDGFDPRLESSWVSGDTLPGLNRQRWENLLLYEIERLQEDCNNLLKDVLHQISRPYYEEFWRNGLR